MPERINGAAFHQKVVGNKTETYIVYAKCDNAFNNIEQANGVNIRVTGNLRDETQKNFEVLVQSIGLRCMPVFMTDPIPVPNLNVHGAPSLTGEGYIWKFAVEPTDIFKSRTDHSMENDVGLLIKDLNGIVLPNTVVLKTTGEDKNIEFIKQVHADEQN